MVYLPTGLGTSWESPAVAPNPSVTGWTFYAKPCETIQKTNELCRLKEWSIPPNRIVWNITLEIEKWWLCLVSFLNWEPIWETVNILGAWDYVCELWWTRVCVYLFLLDKRWSMLNQKTETWKAYGPKTDCNWLQWLSNFCLTLVSIFKIETTASDLNRCKRPLSLKNMFGMYFPLPSGKLT